MNDEMSGDVHSSLIPHPLSFELVDLARFERATSTFAQSRSYSAELQVQAFPIANWQLPICNCLPNPRQTENRQLAIGSDLAGGTGLEPASDKCAVVFGTTALPVRLPFLRKPSLGL
jgi:hypothetical protein